MSEEIPELEWHETVHRYGDESGRYHVTLTEWHDEYHDRDEVAAAVYVDGRERFHSGYSEYGTDLAAAQDALAFYFKMADVTRELHDGDA